MTLRTQFSRLLHELDTRSATHATHPALTQAQANLNATLRAYVDTLVDASRARPSNDGQALFTIALYGETNAGKSTLIEALRLLLQAPGKQQEQAQFHALAAPSTLASPAMAARDQARAELRERSAALRAEIAALTRWGRWLARWRPLPAWRAYQTARRSWLALPHAASPEPSTDRSALAQWQDGAIIGNGASDFTRHATRYVFEHDGQRFALLDLPGIEGRDPDLQARIQNAIAQAHVVLFITPKAAPPHQGEPGAPGTLALIAQQLANQTEVWAIFNKRIQHPQALPAGELVSADERAGLAELASQLSTHFGPRFRGVRSVSALPAFYALADCLLPDTSLARGRDKFRAALSREQLLDRSQILALRDFLCQDLQHGYQQRMQDAEQHKTDILRQQGLALLQAEQAALDTLIAGLRTQAERIGAALSQLCAQSRQTLQQRCQRVLDDARHTLRLQLHADIDNGLSQKAFAQRLHAATTEAGHTISAALQATVTPILVDAQTRMQQLATDHVERTGALLHLHQAAGFAALAEPPPLTLPAGPAIPLANVASTLGGAALLAWNPAGWVLATVGAATLALGLYNSVRGLLSKAQRQAQQRDAADATLQQMFQSLQAGLQAPLQALNEDLAQQARAWQAHIEPPLPALCAMRAALARTAAALNAATASPV